MTKWITGLVVVVLIAGGVAWWGGWLERFGLPAPSFSLQGTGTPDEGASQAPVSDLPTAASDVSDAAISQDAAAIDAQLDALNADTTNIDASLNDTAVPQEY